MKKLIIAIILIIALAFFVHWTGIPLGSYVDRGLDWVFSWTNKIIPRLTEILPAWGEKIKSSLGN